jgi:hypothetical protein
MPKMYKWNGTFIYSGASNSRQFLINDDKGEKFMKRNRLIQIVLGLAIITSLVAVTMAGPLAGHPNLRRARNSINRALADCRAARADERHGEFGGHRDRAEDLLNQAKAELDAAAEFANTHR